MTPFRFDNQLKTFPYRATFERFLERLSLRDPERAAAVTPDEMRAAAFRLFTNSFYTLWKADYYTRKRFLASMEKSGKTINPEGQVAIYEALFWGSKNPELARSFQEIDKPPMAYNELFPFAWSGGGRKPRLWISDPEQNTISERLVFESFCNGLAATTDYEALLLANYQFYEWSKAPKPKRSEIVAQWAKPQPLRIIITSETMPGEGTLQYYFSPLWFHENHVFHEIVIELILPPTWLAMESKEWRTLWDGLAYEINALSPEAEKSDAIEFVPEKNLGRRFLSPRPFEEIKFSRLPASQEELFELFKQTDYAQENAVTADQMTLDSYGVALTEAHGHALDAIQRLFASTNYNGNVEAGSERIQAVRLARPRVKFSPTEYFEQYGVSRYQTSRGWMEFSGKQRDEALAALDSLAKQQRLIVAQVPIQKDGKKKILEYRTYEPLIRLIGLSEQDPNTYVPLTVLTPSTREIIVELSPVLAVNLGQQVD
ncbi:MAG: hypothetical protein OEM52_07035, partial [bacterium]|nr:hypothetical protein [bacterium]